MSFITLTWEYNEVPSYSSCFPCRSILAVQFNPNFVQNSLIPSRTRSSFFRLVAILMGTEALYQVFNPY